MKMKINYDKSFESCSICKEKTLDKLLEVSKAPMFLGCCVSHKSEDSFLSFDVLICNTCGLIQTNCEVYKESYSVAHSQANGPTWEKHHHAFAHFIEEKTRNQLTIHSVLEIGVSLKPVARLLKERKEKVFYIDPISQCPFILQENETYISGFFPEEKVFQKVDLMIGSHVFEHMFDLLTFINSVSDQLNEGGVLAISIPQFETWFKKHYLNAISPEHITYAFENQIHYLAFLTGLEVDMKYHEEHSLFILFKFTNSKPKDVPAINVEKSRKLIEKWARRFIEIVTFQKFGFNNNEFFLTGASHLSQYYILSNFENSGKILGVLDNSEDKWGKRLYGTAVEAKSFDSIQHVHQPNIVIFPSPYAKEMKEQILQINNSAIVYEFSDL